MSTFFHILSKFCEIINAMKCIVGNSHISSALTTRKPPQSVKPLGCSCNQTMSSHEKVSETQVIWKRQNFQEIWSRRWLIHMWRKVSTEVSTTTRREGEKKVDDDWIGRKLIAIAQRAQLPRKFGTINVVVKQLSVSASNPYHLLQCNVLHIGR